MSSFRSVAELSCAEASRTTHDPLPGDMFTVWSRFPQQLVTCVHRAMSRGRWTASCVDVGLNEVRPRQGPVAGIMVGAIQSIASDHGKVPARYEIHVHHWSRRAGTTLNWPPPVSRSPSLSVSFCGRCGRDRAVAASLLFSRRICLMVFGIYLHRLLFLPFSRPHVWL